MQYGGHHQSVGHGSNFAHIGIRNRRFGDKNILWSAGGRHIEIKDGGHFLLGTSLISPNLVYFYP
jgi:hypothetical protein